MQVDTKHAARRSLRFSSVAELRAEIERLVEADRSGRLEYTGNWTLGQMLGHLSAWIDYGYSGYPLGKPPWFVMLFMKVMRRRLLEKGFPAGLRMPKVEGGAYAIDRLSTDEGLRRMNASLDRLARREPPSVPSPAFGPMTIDEFVQGSLRHAELHLGFCKPRP